MSWRVSRRFIAPHEPPAPHSFRQSVWSGLSGAAAIAVVGVLTWWTKSPLLAASLGSTAFLIFGESENHASQPRNVLGGYLICACIGLAAGHGLGTTITSQAIAVGLSIVAMEATRTIHPPAAGAALLATMGPTTIPGLLLPIMGGSAVLIAVALLLNNVLPERRYPQYWY